MMDPVLHILHLEDDPLDSRRVLHLLRQAGLAVEMDRVAGERAFKEALEQKDYTLILSDYTIPGADAGELLRFARAARPEVPFVFFSGTMGEEVGIEMLKLGASDYVFKERDGRLAPAVRRALQEAEEVIRRRKAEEALRQNEALLRKVLSASTVGVLFFRLDGRIHQANGTFERLSGYRCDELVEAAHWQMLTAPEYWQETERAATALAEHGAVAPYEKQMVRKDGSRWWGLFAPMRLSGSGWNAECAEFIIDITERKQTEEELKTAKMSAERAKIAADEANRAKDQFLAALSHELRTPLTPVVTAVSMLQKQWRGDRGSHDALEMIRRNVEMEARLIGDLLDVTRITRGKVELDRRPAPLCEVIRRAVEVCKPDLEARQLHLGVDLGPDGPYLIHADAARLQQVFWNLLKNAIKFTPDGGRVDIHCRRDDGSVAIEIVDSGEGIDPAVLPHIFNPFEQGSTRVTRQFGGLGLGLTITKGLVEMHGGSISAHSEGKGKGATFTVRLPIHDPQKASPVAETARDTVTSEGGGSPAGTRRSLRILLVEDHGDTARIMRRLLTAEGHEVETAGDVATALELAAKKRFDLLLSDLGLPDGSGMDLMRSLRERGHALPGIALSGYGQEEDIRRSHEAGFAEHLTKPTSPDRLAEAIATIAGEA